MRVAANIVEKVLMQAESELRDQPADKKHSTSYDNLVAAFKRAAELRDRPYRTVMLRGRKSRKAQEVILTNQERGEAGHLYVMCLVPYTEQQYRDAGTYKYRTPLVVKEDGEVMTWKLNDSGVAPCYHSQWIRSDRLRQAAHEA